MKYAVPARMTLALDAMGLHGPGVDEALGVREPTVDLWEAGVLLPTRAQVVRLAALTDQLVEFFYDPVLTPVGRMFICDRRRRPRNALTIVEEGELGAPPCPECGRSVWARMQSSAGPVLIDRPDLYGSMVMAKVTKKAWGVRPVQAGETVNPELRRRPHGCPVYTLTCTVPSGVGGAACAELARLYPVGPRCDPHAPG